MGDVRERRKQTSLETWSYNVYNEITITIAIATTTPTKTVAESKSQALK